MSYKEVHMGGFSEPRRSRFEVYHDDEVDDRYYLGVRPGSNAYWHAIEWCQRTIGECDYKWGIESDEFYSPLTSGDMFWFTEKSDMTLFKMTWCL